MSDETEEETAPAELPELPTEFEVHGNTVHLRIPSSIYVRRSIVMAHTDTPLAAYGSAFGVCYPKLARAMPWNDKPVKHGRAVVDYLAGQGWSMAEIERAGQVALAHIMRSLLDWEKVRATADFSEAQEGTQTEPR